VLNNTTGLYRYPDLTPHAEFLFDCVIETIEKDWPQELDFLARFDKGCRAVRNIVDMPDAKLRLLVRLLLQNGGTLSKTKRNSTFRFLTDTELEQIHDAFSELLEDSR
jgi:hypothetical protein